MPNEQLCFWCGEPAYLKEGGYHDCEARKPGYRLKMEIKAAIKVAALDDEGLEHYFRMAYYKNKMAIRMRKAWLGKDA